MVTKKYQRKSLYRRVNPEEGDMPIPRSPTPNSEPFHSELFKQLLVYPRSLLSARKQRGPIILHCKTTPLFYNNDQQTTVKYRNHFTWQAAVTNHFYHILNIIFKKIVLLVFTSKIFHIHLQLRSLSLDIINAKQFSWILL